MTRSLFATYTGHIGWSHGITFTDVNGAAPIATTGDLMNAHWVGGGKKTIARGFDLLNFNITSEILRAGDYMKLNADHLYLADTAGFSVIEPNGPSVNANLLLRGRGTGLTGIGNWAGNADAPVNGYILVCDHTGVARKVATIA